MHLFTAIYLFDFVTIASLLLLGLYLFRGGVIDGIGRMPRALARMVIISSILWIIEVIVYGIVTYEFNGYPEIYPEEGAFITVALQLWLPIFLMVLGFVIGAGQSTNGQDKSLALRRIGFCISIAASLFLLIYLIRSAEIYAYDVQALLWSFLFAVVPISFFLLGVFLVKSNPSLIEEVSLEQEVQFANISVARWLKYLAISIIPLVGLIYLIKWGRDKRNPIRKNWAVAYFIWSLILTIVLTLLGFIIFQILS